MRGYNHQDRDNHSIILATVMGMVAGSGITLGLVSLFQFYLCKLLCR